MKTYGKRRYTRRSNFRGLGRFTHGADFPPYQLATRLNVSSFTLDAVEIKTAYAAVNQFRVVPQSVALLTEISRLIFN
jgi:hypothetical protein